MVNRRPKRSPRVKLTTRQRLELMSGLDAIRMNGVEGGWDERSQFESREAKLGAWNAHKKDILSAYRGTDRRPAGWWRFEAGVDRWPPSGGNN